MTDKEASTGELRELGFVDSRVFNGNTNRNTFVPVRLYHPPFLFLRRAPRVHPTPPPTPGGACVEATNNSCTSVCRTSARRTVVDAQSKKHPERDESRGGTAAAAAAAVAFE